MPVKKRTEVAREDEASSDAASPAARLEEAEARARAAEAAEARTRRELERANKALAHQTARLDAVTRSASWRATRPLRVVMGLAKGNLALRHVLQSVAPRWVSGWDGIRQGLRRARPGVRGMGPRSEPRPATFPQPGALATLPELSGASVEPLDCRVSVIVPTFNAGAEFYWFLRKIRGQKGLAGVEIVIVDSGSSDGTAELAEAFGAKVVRIAGADFSHSYARNLGADNATGDVYLFTVQDAYPVGDHWLHALASALVRPREPSLKVDVVSCAEFPRRDSELVYNAAIEVHSRFLGCQDGDRIGAFTGDDQLSLRTQGQVSDLACMISAQTFHRYRYEGRYAEDLTLGVRLIRDGLRTAMLSSVKVIHSHNRTPAYHLKRTFVDVLFLDDSFPDLESAPVQSIGGLLAAAGPLQELVETWRPKPSEAPAAALRRLAARAREVRSRPADPRPAHFGVPALDAWMRRAAAGEQADGSADAQALRLVFAHRIEHLCEFVERTYSTGDDYLAGELAAAAVKTLAASLGAQLAGYYLHQSRPGSSADPQPLGELRDLMLAGV